MNIESSTIDKTTFPKHDDSALIWHVADEKKILKNW